MAYQRGRPRPLDGDRPVAGAVGSERSEPRRHVDRGASGSRGLSCGTRRRVTDSLPNLSQAVVAAGRREDIP